MSEALQNWLAQELARRGWSHREFARQVGMSQSFVSNILTGRQPPSANFCNRVSTALDVAPETVLRLAGILPGEPTPDSLSPTAAEIARLADTLSPEQRQQLLDYARFLSQQNR